MGGHDDADACVVVAVIVAGYLVSFPSVGFLILPFELFLFQNLLLASVIFCVAKFSDECGIEFSSLSPCFSLYQ